MTKIDQVAEKVYRICTLEPQFSLQFNQLLIDDDCPALTHTRMYPMYDEK